MIWYLLYFLRGTTKPPVLDSRHPLRHSFTRYGGQASRHPVITLMISVTVATLLIYPFPFLYTNNFTNGASNLPHHVWTSAQPFAGDLSTSPDVVMRSIWVHGSYMKALEPDVLQTALELQDQILGETVNFNPRQTTRLPDVDASTMASLSPAMRDQYHAINGLSNSSWFFHSPLQYWSCSAQQIAEDKDIIGTVNAHSQQSTSVNVTLRHSIVFSGKRFENHRLVAADAIVITLIHMRDSPVGRQWELNAERLARQNSNRWRIYPAEGRSLASTLYEFRFLPLSFQDDLFLGIAYSLTSIYFLLSLSKVRALKSRLGLLCAVTTQIAVSIMSSFTICAVLKIDLSKIPREAYPLVVLTVGLENIFRLINAVIMTPPENPTTSRIAEALGSTGHIALACVTQNLAILWVLSRVVSPGVRSFCTFAAIALLFDLFYLMTFFVAVLTIDVRRLELSDSLTRAPSRSLRSISTKEYSKTTWTEALIKGEAPFSTRIAGTVMMVSFILAAQWHFFDNESFMQTAFRFVHLIKATPQPPRHSSPALLSSDVHPARSPTSWLKLQDHETAHEVIKIIKPNAHSYIARVYDPLIFVLNGSDRTPTNHGIRPFLPAVYDFARHQSTPFIVAIVIVIAGVSLLMNYLLWDENSESLADDRAEDEPLLVVKTLGGHALDIVLLATSDNGAVASVGLDRRIRVWDIRKGGSSYVVHAPESQIDPFPVWKMSIDMDSNWLAILSKDRVLLWNIPERRWGPIMPVALNGRVPAAFFFGYSPTELINPVVVVRQNGLMTEMHMETKEISELQICKTPLVCVLPHVEKAVTHNLPPPPFRIITSSRRGCVHVATQTETGWISEEVPCPTEFNDREIVSVLPLPDLSSFLAVREQTVELVDIVSYKVTHTFSTKSMVPNSLRCFHSTRRRPQCGSVGLAYLSLAYTAATGGQCVLQMYLPERDGDTICFRDPRNPGSKTCCLWKETVEHLYEVPNPGRWEALKIPYIVGIRKCTLPVEKEAMQPTAGLRRRAEFERRVSGELRRQQQEDSWEVWSLSMHGEMSSVPLNRNSAGQDYLLTDDLGPCVTLGKRSLGVVLGNIMKVIRIGNERFDGPENAKDDPAYVGMTTSRRKKVSFAKRNS